MRELAQPFSMDDLEWRVQDGGISNNRPWIRLVAYVTNRALQNRLDEVVGVFNWRNEYKELPNLESKPLKNGGFVNGALCGISIKIGSDWVTKWDGSDNTQIEAIKGGLSGAMKRAGVQWGVGRYLYDTDVMYADCILEDDYKKLKWEDKKPYEKADIKTWNPKTKKKDIKNTVYWKAKKLDAKFLPQQYVSKAIVDSITKLCEETKTDKKDILYAYGLEDIRDLYLAEAGKIVELLLVKKRRLKESEENEK